MPFHLKLHNIFIPLLGLIDEDEKLQQSDRDKSRTHGSKTKDDNRKKQTSSLSKQAKQPTRSNVEALGRRNSSDGRDYRRLSSRTDEAKSSKATLRTRAMPWKNAKGSNHATKQPSNPKPANVNAAPLARDSGLMPTGGGSVASRAPKPAVGASIGAATAG